MEENMQESMQGIKRSYKCAELSSNNIGEKVTVMGWVQKRRNLGSLLFIDLRDEFGIKFQMPAAEGLIKNEINVQMKVKAIEKK